MQNQSERVLSTDIAAAERQRQRIVSLARGASLELTAGDQKGADSCRDLLAPGTSVYISRMPSDTADMTVAAAVRLKRFGFNPVPHIGARYLPSREALDDVLARLHGEAEVVQVLAIAGDVDHAAGPFPSSLDVISTGLLEKHGIRKVGIAGYPEGHPKIDGPGLADALRGKLAYLAQAGIEPLIVTQFCFEAEPLVRFSAELRANGITAPLHVGLAGPANIATLARFAVRCGIGTSVKALMGGRGNMARLLVDAGPETVVAALAQSGLDLGGLHFYTFGGVKKSGNWLKSVGAGEFTLLRDGADFDITR